jgi:hypothetical protein
MTIDRLISNTEALDFNAVIRETVEETTEELTIYQQQQMYAGRRSDGDTIYPSYTLLTEEIKTGKGQPTDRVTLKDTGAFYRGITVTASANSVKITSTDSKTGMLEEKYGEEIFGLNADSAAKYSENELEPIALKKIKEQILK